MPVIVLLKASLRLLLVSLRYIVARLELVHQTLLLQRECLVDGVLAAS